MDPEWREHHLQSHPSHTSLIIIWTNDILPKGDHVCTTIMRLSAAPVWLLQQEEGTSESHDYIKL